MKNTLQQGALLATFAGIFWGTTGTAQALLPAGAEPFSVGAVRIMIGSMGFFLLLWLMGTFRQPVKWMPKEILIAAIGAAGFQIGFFSGLPRTGVAIGTIVAIGVAPIVAGLLGRIFYNEKLTRKWMIVTALAISGCVLITFTGAEIQMDFGGILLAMMGGSFYALCGLGVKGMTKSRSLLPNIAAMLLLAAIFLTLINWGGDYSWVFGWPGFGLALYLGLIATIVPYWLFALALKYIPIAKTYTFSLTEPVVGFLLGVFLLNEVIHGAGMAGVAILMCGLIWLALPDRKK